MTLIQIRVHQLKTGKFFIATDQLSRGDASDEESKLVEKIQDRIAEDINELLHVKGIKKGSCSMEVTGNGKRL